VAISHTKLKILQLISNGNEVGYSSVSDLLNCSYEACRKHIKQLEKKEYIEIDTSGKIHIFKLTDTGLDLLDSSTTPSEGVVYGENSQRKSNKLPKPTWGEVTFSLHNFRVKTKLVTQEKFHSNRREEILESKDLNWSYDEETDSYRTHIKGQKVRITRSAIVIQLKEIRGGSPFWCKDRGMEKALKVINWINDHTRFTIQGDYGFDVQAEVVSQEIAMFNSKLARAVIESDYPTREFRIYDESGRTVMFVDNSNGEYHLETKGDFAEEMMEEYIDLCRTFRKQNVKITEIPEIKRQIIKTQQNFTEFVTDQNEINSKFVDNINNLTSQSNINTQLIGSVASELYNGEARETSNSSGGQQKAKVITENESQFSSNGSSGNYYDEEMREAMDREGMDYNI